MDVTGLGFGPGALAIIALYLVSMIGVGWLGRLRRQSDSMVDFYLAGRSMGFAVLLLTLYATQYSGNTMFGYTGKSYRIGFQWTVSILFMFSIIVGYLLFAPRLVAVARKASFITPGDYIRHRFRSPVLTLLATIIMIYALGNYTLAQLKAMGAAVEGITDGQVPAAYGIVALAVIMVSYETLGGMRSVAWTDVIQGVVLLIGFSILLFIVPDLGGGLTRVVETLSVSEPAMVTVPTLETCNTWISFALLLGCGAAIYPQAIQRLYASRNVRVLKRSLAVMAFMPLTTTLIALLCGLPGRDPRQRGCRHRPGAGTAVRPDHGAVGGGILARRRHLRRGAGGAHVDGRLGVAEHLVDVYPRRLPGSLPSAQYAGGIDSGGQVGLLGRRRRSRRHRHRDRKDPRASAGAEV